MKVKMFSTSGYINMLEEKINEFIKDKIIHDIKFTANSNGKYVMVMYDDLFTVESVPIEGGKYMLLKGE